MSFVLLQSGTWRNSVRSTCFFFSECRNVGKFSKSGIGEARNSLRKKQVRRLQFEFWNDLFLGLGKISSVWPASFLVSSDLFPMFRRHWLIAILEFLKVKDFLIYDTFKLKGNQSFYEVLPYCYFTSCTSLTHSANHNWKNWKERSIFVWHMKFCYICH